MNKHHSSESGQVIVLLAVTIIVLLGFAALAIDGGMVFSDRRHAQNAADAAALTGVLHKSNDPTPSTNDDIIPVMLENAYSNGYEASLVSIAFGGPYTTIKGTYNLVTVTITKTTNTAFAHLFTGGPVVQHLTSVGQFAISQAAFPNVGLISLASASACNSGGAAVGIGGGGASGGVYTVNSGILLNVPDEGCANACAMQPPSNQGQIWVDPDFTVNTVGVCDYEYPCTGTCPPTASSWNNINSGPFNTNVNGGMPFTDPLADIPAPVCNTPGQVVTNAAGASTITPGYYTNHVDFDAVRRDGVHGQTTVYLASGIYCFQAGFSSNNTNVERVPDGQPGAGGVVLYISGGNAVLQGGDLKLYAPSAWDCPSGYNPDPSEICNWMGMLIFGSRTQDQSIGTQSSTALMRLKGMVYAPRAVFTGGGGGATYEDATVVGQVLARQVQGAGGATFYVYYSLDWVYNLPPLVGISQ